MQPLSYTNKSLNFFPFFKVSTLWLIEVIFQYLETTWMKIDRFVTLYTLLCRKEGSKYYRKKTFLDKYFWAKRGKIVLILWCFYKGIWTIFETNKKCAKNRNLIAEHYTKILLLTSSGFFFKKCIIKFEGWIFYNFSKSLT